MPSDVLMKSVLIIPPLDESPIEYLRDHAHEVSDNTSVVVGRETLLQGESLNFSWLVLTEWPPDMSRIKLDDDRLTFDNESKLSAQHSGLIVPQSPATLGSSRNDGDGNGNDRDGDDCGENDGDGSGTSHHQSAALIMSDPSSNGSSQYRPRDSHDLHHSQDTSNHASNDTVNDLSNDVLHSENHAGVDDLSPSKIRPESDYRSLSPSRKRMSVGAAMRGIFGKVKSEGRKGSVGKSGVNLEHGQEMVSSVGDESFKMSSVEMSSAGQELVNASGSASGASVNAGGQQEIGLRRHQSEFDCKTMPHKRVHSKKSRQLPKESEDEQTSMTSILQSLEGEEGVPVLEDPLSSRPTSLKKEVNASKYIEPVRASIVTNNRPKVYHPYDIYDKLVTADILTDLVPATSALTQQLWESQSDPVEQVAYSCQYIPVYFESTCIGCLYKMRLNITVLKNRLGLFNRLQCVLKQKDSSCLPDGTLGFLDGDAPMACPDPLVTVSHPIRVCRSVELCTYLIEDDQLFVKIANVTEDYTIIIDSMNTRTAPLQEAEFPLAMPPKSEYVISVPTSLMRPTNLGEKRTWNELDHKTVFTLAIQWHINGNSASWAQHAADCRPHIPTPLQMTLLSCVGGDFLGSQLTIEAQITNYENEPIDLVLLSPDVDDELEKILGQCAPSLPYPSNIISLIRENLSESSGTAWSLSFQAVGVIKPRDSKRLCLSAWVVGEQERARFPSLFLLDLTHSRLILVEP